MTSVYENLIYDLRIKSKNKDIEFDKLICLINKKYDKNTEIENDTIKIVQNYINIIFFFFKYINLKLNS